MLHLSVTNVNMRHYFYSLIYLKKHIPHSSFYTSANTESPYYMHSITRPVAAFHAHVFPLPLLNRIICQFCSKTQTMQSLVRIFPYIFITLPIFSRWIHISLCVMMFHLGFPNVYYICTCVSSLC